MSEPLISLPEPGEQSPEDYLQISRRALQQSRLHLAESDRLQASEKVSGAVSAALKGIAQLRGWRHESHALRASVASQLGAELGHSTPAAQTLYLGRSAGDDQHNNYYENFLFENDILQSIEAAESFVKTVAQLMDESPRPFTIARDSDAHRVYQLTGYRPGVGASDAQGFANFTGELREE